jgi:hypothetical protein
MPPAPGSFKVGPVTFEVMSKPRQFDLSRYPTVLLNGRKYRFLKVVLYVDSGVHTVQFTLTRPANAWLYYTSWAHWQSRNALGAIGQVVTKRVHIESCPKQRVAFPGGIIVAGNECLAFRAIDDSHHQPVTGRLLLGSSDC